MENKSHKYLFDKVINQGFCIGCGACACLVESPFKIVRNEDGKFIATINCENNTAVDFLDICPFTSRKNETEIGANIFSKIEAIQYSSTTGYFLKNYASYVKKDNFREMGSSGGMVSWIACQLLTEGKVDAIIHVTQSMQIETNNLFEYTVSKTIQDIKSGSKSKYYPVEMSKVLKFVRDNPAKYAIVGVPCFIKSIRLLANIDATIRDRIIYTIGLVCGHLKSDFYAKSIAWEMGFDPNEILNLDFRVKIPGQNSNNYAVSVTGKIDSRLETKTKNVEELFTSNWGYGLFKYEACDYCDDVLGETADISIGDAWIRGYMEDKLGTNVVIVRNSEINNMIIRHKEDLFLENLSVEEIHNSQAGGFRHRREGLSYRLYLIEKNEKWCPKRRVEPTNRISIKRKIIYVNCNIKSSTF